MPTSYHAVVEQCAKPNRASAVAAAAARELNDELTVILSSVATSIEAVGAEHPALPSLLDLRAAAQRCAGKASIVLDFTARSGFRPTATPLADLTSPPALL